MTRPKNWTVQELSDALKWAIKHGHTDLPVTVDTANTLHHVHALAVRIDRDNERVALEVYEP